MCGLLNVPHIGDGENDSTVTVELRFLTAQNEAQAKEQITPQQKSRGWSYRFHLGRHAMKRDICRACLIPREEIRKEFARKRSSELKASQHSDNYYSALCGD